MLEQPFLAHLKQKEIFTLKPYLHIFSSWFSCLKKDNISQWCADISTCQGSLINATTICVTVNKVLTMYFFHQRFIEALKLRAWYMINHVIRYHNYLFALPSLLLYYMLRYFKGVRTYGRRHIPFIWHGKYLDFFSCLWENNIFSGA